MRGTSWDALLGGELFVELLIITSHLARIAFDSIEKKKEELNR